MDTRHGDDVNQATQPEPSTMAATDVTATAAESKRPAGFSRGILALLVVFVICQTVRVVAGLAASQCSPLFGAIDPDGAFVRLYVHHIALLVLALAVMAAWRRWALPRWGINLREWKTSLRWFGWFALLSTLGVLLLEIVPHLVRGTSHDLDFPLTLRNAVGRLGCYYLLSGIAEEPLFRGFVMGVLLVYWRREFRLRKLVVPVAALWAAPIFVFEHLGYSLEPPRIVFAWPEQALCLGLGLYYATALYRTRSLLCPVLAHGFFRGTMWALLYILAWWTAPPPWVLPADFETGKAGDGTLADVLERIRAQNNLPGLAAVAMNSDGVIEMAAVGLRADGFPEHVTPEDRWCVGSITKPFTATLAARLVDKGLISWETTIEEVFPDLKDSMRPEYRTVRLEELLHHVSGMPWDPPCDRLYRFDAALPARPQRRAFAREILTIPPANPRGALVPSGSRMQVPYSNCGYMVAGVMLEERAKADFEDLMAREVFIPLGMTHSGFGVPGTPGARDQPWGHLAALRLAGARKRAQDIWGPLAPQYLPGSWLTLREWEPLDPGSPAADYPPYVDPSGRIHSTLGDMAKFAAVHMIGARGGGVSFLSHDSFRKIHTSPDVSGYAMAWVTTTDNPLGVATMGGAWACGRILFHRGCTARWLADLQIAPDRDFALFVATNAEGVRGEGVRGMDQAAQTLIRRFEATVSTRCRIEPDPPITGREVVITYRAKYGPLAASQQLSLHYGFDGWQRVQDVPMRKLAEYVWVAPVDMPRDARKIDFCFTNGDKWDNNSGRDWHAGRD